MTPRQALASVALSLGLVATGVVIIGEEKPIATEEKCDTYAELSRAPDGGRAYTCLVVVDAGEPDCTHTRPPELCLNTFVYERRVLSRSTHVRAKRDDGTCLIREPLPGIDAGFKAPRFFGVGNRFPRAWAVGDGCEEVAGLLADKADEHVDEAELVARQRDGGERPTQDTRGGR